LGKTHPLLKRQIEKYLSDVPSIPDEWQKFLQAVEGSYEEADSDRSMLERSLEISSREHIQATAQMSKIRELALGIESRSTVDEVLAFAVEAATDIPGIIFVLVQTLDESRQFVITPYYSRIRSNAPIKMLRTAGFNVEDYIGKHSTSGRLKFPLAKLRVAQDYLENPRVIVKESLAELLSGVWPKPLCDSIQKIVGYKRFVITPLMVDGKSWGNLLFFLVGHVSQGTLEMIASHCALGIKKAQLVESLQKQNLKLRESEEKYRSIFNSANDIILLIDNKGKVLDVNLKIKEIGGYDPDEFVGRSILSLTRILPPKSLTKIATNFGKRMIGAEIQPYEVEMIKKDGQVAHVEISARALRQDGKVIGDLAIIRDITERRQAEMTLRQQKDLIDRTLMTTPNAVLVVDKGRRIVLANKTFKRDFASKQDPEGKTLDNFIGTNTVVNSIARVLSNKESGERIEFRFQVEGEERTFTAEILYMGEGQALVIFTDITADRVKQDRLYLTDRLASVGEMASGIAHEINNPLTSIIGLSQLLKEEEFPGDAGEDIASIYKESQRAAKIVKNLLAFARRHEPVRQTAAVGDIISDVLALRAYEHKVKSIQVITNIPSDTPQVMADYYQIQQVFMNIVLNAEQAMIDAHGKGNLTITAERVESVVKISFTDDGPGIKPENLKRIFDPFFTTKEVGKGTGLGLSICYGIVTTHGGKIYAESELAKGATFVIELPADSVTANTTPNKRVDSIPIY
jgi:PAS domain S-box-containing protein